MSDTTSNFQKSFGLGGDNDFQPSRARQWRALPAFLPLTKRLHYMLAAQLLDMLVVFIMAMLTYRLVDHNAQDLQPLRYVLLSAAIGVVCHFGFSRGHLYEIEFIRDAGKANRQLLAHWTRIFLFLAAMAALTHQQAEISRSWFAGLYVGGAAAFVTLRVVLARLYNAGLARGFYRRTVAVVGCGEEAERLVWQLHDRRGLNIVGVFGQDADDLPTHVGNASVRGDLEALLTLSRRTAIDTVLLAVPHTTCGGLRGMIAQLSVQPLEIMVVAESIGLDRVSSTGTRAADFTGIALVPVVDKPISEAAFFLKGAVERGIALLLLLAIAPVFAVCAAGIKLSGKGPVLFRQKRVGYKGEEFFIYKFRTMHVSAVPNIKLTQRDDPRVFGFGRLLRKTSVDELPQLINVLRGEMALVGPRPHMAEARAAGALYFEAVNTYAGRHRVKPGITGWAQVNGWRGPTDTVEQIQNRVQHDLHYIENWSFNLDIAIIFRTIFVGFFGKNAF